MHLSLLLLADHWSSVPFLLPPTLGLTTHNRGKTQTLINL